MSTADPVAGMPKDLAKVGRKLRRAGWEVTMTKGHHVRWTAPDGQTTVSGLTPGPGGLTSTLRQLRRIEASQLGPFLK